MYIFSVKKSYARCFTITSTRKFRVQDVLQEFPILGTIIPIEFFGTPGTFFCSNSRVKIILHFLGSPMVSNLKVRV